MEYLIENPATRYGVEFIRRMRRRFDARAVCYYTQAAQQPVDRRAFPELFSRDHVAASYLVAPAALEAFAEHLRRHHRIGAVVPHSEQTILRSVTMAEALGLEWVQPQVMRRFRDKQALKAHLRAADPGLRINHAQLVGSPDEAIAVARRHGLSRFVLKPNDGFGNRHVGTFDAGGPPGRVAEYWSRTGAGTVLLEEFIGGREYHCNGQVDADGGITIVDVGRTHFAETERGEIVCQRTDQTPHGAPEFAVIADYVRRVVAASGLRRCPFHAELRVDAAGPSLLECAARIIGADWAPFTRLMHGDAFDMFDLAAHYYGSAAPYGDAGLDWRRYDEHALCKVRGVSVKEETIRQLEGVAAVERLPEFLAWNQRPALGQRVGVTANLFSSPYAVMLRCDCPAAFDGLEQRIRELVKWNTRPLSPAERLGTLARRAAGHLQWRLERRRRESLRRFDRVFAPAGETVVR